MIWRMRNLAAALLAALLFVAGGSAQTTTLRVMGWNLQGNGNDINPKRLVKELGIKQGVDIWGLSEVRPTLFNDFLEGAKEGESDEFDIIKGESGGGIRLAIIYNKTRLELVDSQELLELFGLEKNSALRAPLIAQFRGKKTKQEFIFMTNHLASGNAEVNKKQAEALREWVKRQELPVINVGDFNSFDNRPTVSILKESWFELEPLHDSPTFRQPLNGRIDHIFIGNRDKAVGWSGMAAVYMRRNDTLAFGPFKDDKESTDHRPIGATFTISAVTPPPVLAADDPDFVRQLLLRIDQLEQRVRDLEKK